MNYLKFLARRSLFALLSAYLVVSTTFLLMNMMIYKQLRARIALAEYGGATPDEIAKLRESFAESHGLNHPLHERYISWLVDIPTLDWGQSRLYGQPVINVLDGRVQTTLEYVLPGVALAIFFGILLGLFAAFSKDGIVDWTSRVGAYTLLGIPAFMSAIYLSFLSGKKIASVGGQHIILPTIGSKTIAAIAVALSLLAGQIRYVRVTAMEEIGQEFVKMLRAKGTTRLQIARHVLRNAAIPIVSLSVAELLSVLMLNIYVIEYVLGIRGLAEANLRAVQTTIHSPPDLQLAIWSSMVLVFIGIVGSLTQDLLYGYLDPRIQSN